MQTKVTFFRTMNSDIRDYTSLVVILDKISLSDDDDDDVVEAIRLIERDFNVLNYYKEYRCDYLCGSLLQRIDSSQIDLVLSSNSSVFVETYIANISHSEKFNFSIEQFKNFL